MGILQAIDRLLAAEPEIGMLAAPGPGFKMPAHLRARPSAGRLRSWAGQAQTLLGLLLILIGISGLAYPLLVTVVAALGSEQPYESTLAQDTPGLMDAKYFWAQIAPQKDRSQRRPAVISPAGAYSQAPRVSVARRLPLQQVRALIAAHAHGRGRLSVVELNLALDRLGAKKTTLAHLCLPGPCGYLQR